MTISVTTLHVPGSYMQDMDIMHGTDGEAGARDHFLPIKSTNAFKYCNIAERILEDGQKMVCIITLPTKTNFSWMLKFFER